MIIFSLEVVVSLSNKSVEALLPEKNRLKGHSCTNISAVHVQHPGDWNSEQACSVLSFTSSASEPTISKIGSHPTKPIPLPRQKLKTPYPLNEGTCAREYFVHLDILVGNFSKSLEIIHDGIETDPLYRRVQNIRLK